MEKIMYFYSNLLGKIYQYRYSLKCVVVTTFKLVVVTSMKVWVPPSLIGLQTESVKIMEEYNWNKIGLYKS